MKDTPTAQVDIMMKRKGYGTGANKVRGQTSDKRLPPFPKRQLLILGASFPRGARLTNILLWQAVVVVLS